MEASFLLYAAAFNFDSIDGLRKSTLDLLSAMRLSRRKGDRIFGSPQIYELDTKLGKFGTVIFEDNADDHELTRNIVELLNKTDATELNPEDVATLKKIFLVKDKCNGLMGFSFKNFNFDSSSTVTNVGEWNNFHTFCVTNHPEYYNSKLNPEDDRFLFNLAYSDLIVGNNWPQFYKEVYQLSPGDKVARLQEIGEEVAKRNYYKYNATITGKNQKIFNSYRSIWEIGTGNSKTYISIDFLHGMFEIHDNKGRHLGEYNYGGLKRSSTEQKHDIII
jgi:hypothetical protein